MKKRLISLMLTLTLLAAGIVPATAAERFPDLEGHWAKAYITKLNDLNYMTGYPDGTVRPDNDITACEALVMLARFYPVSTSASELIHADKGEFVKSTVDPTLEWAYDEIEICLAAGILTENELKNFHLTAPILKETLAVLLVRALQMTKEAAEADADSLEFDDAEDIQAQFRGHVAVLKECGIINGNTRNQFSPKSSVTRGVVAAMLVRGLEHNESAGRRLGLDGYDNVASYDGVVAAVGVTSLTLRDMTGLERIFDIPDDAALTLDGETTRLTESLRGKYASIRVKDKLVTNVAVDDTTSWVQGMTDSVTRERDNYRIVVRPSGANKTEIYNLQASSSVTLDGESRDAAALRQNMFVSMIVVGRQISKLTAATGTYSVDGTISSLAYGTPVVLEVSDAGASRFSFQLDLSALPEITRGGKTAGVDRLSIGDSVTMSIRNCKLERISASANETTLSGVVQTITSDLTGVTWVIQELSGDTHKLTVDPAANVYQGSKAILISDVQTGDTVVVSTNGHSITEVQLKSASANTSGKLSGTVLNVNADAKKITLTNTSNRLVYITLASKCTILKAATGESIKIDKLSVDDQIVAYGIYTDATKFDATSIVLEQ